MYTYTCILWAFIVYRTSTRSTAFVSCVENEKPIHSYQEPGVPTAWLELLVSQPLYVQSTGSPDKLFILQLITLLHGA